MSIDHGKFLALLAEVLPPRPLPGSIDSGSACSFTMSPLAIEQMHIRFDMLNSALAQPAEAVEYPEAAAVCAEAYQVVGCMLDDLGIFGTERAQKILDNLSQHRLVHDDVLPWPSMKTDAAEAVEGESLDDVLSAYGQASPEFDASTLMAFIDKYPEFASALRRYATVQLTSVPATQAEIDSLPTDAAQGAVAWMNKHGSVMTDELKTEFIATGVGFRVDAEGYDKPLYTHPQAAPAQGDVPPGTRKAMQLGAECLRKSGVAGGPEYADVLEYWLAKHPAAPAQGDGWVLVPLDAITKAATELVFQDCEGAAADLLDAFRFAAPSPEPWS